MIRKKISVKECSEITGLSIPTIYRDIKIGLIPASKIGRRVLIDLQGLEDVLGCVGGHND